MTVFDAIILGLVEGVTEFLPVSSTGHLILVDLLLGLHVRVDRESAAAFTIVVQGGAILAVLWLYPHRVGQLATGIWHAGSGGRRLAMNLAIAFVPAAVLGVALGDIITEHLFGPAPVLAALLCGGALMIASDRWQRHRASRGAPRLGLDDLSVRGALAIGASQCAALWPGTSRSMVTMLAAVALGMDRRDAAEFSFLLGLPTLTAACAYSAAEAAYAGNVRVLMTLGSASMVTGLIVATVSAVVSIRWMVSFLGHRGFAPFGWYRIFLSVGLGFLFLAGVLAW